MPQTIAWVGQIPRLSALSDLIRNFLSRPTTQEPGSNIKLCCRAPETDPPLKHNLTSSNNRNPVDMTKAEATKNSLQQIEIYKMKAMTGDFMPQLATPFRIRPYLCFAFLAAVFETSGARAADFISSQDAEAMGPQAPHPARFGPIRQKLHDWDVVMGAGAIFKPIYEGSDEFDVSPIPFVSATFFDRLTIDPSGLELKAYERGPFEFDVKLGYDSGRSEDDADQLRGLGDVDFGISVGSKATLSYGPADVFVSVDKTIGGSDGLLATVGMALKAPVTESFILGAEASATFADKNYLESYFGIDAGQSARSGYQQYKPSAGIKSVDLAVSATYLINDNWVLRGEQKLGIIVGDAADSPIVKEKLQPSTMIGLGYRF